VRPFLAALALVVVVGAIWFGIRKPAPETVAVKSEDKPAPTLVASSPAVVPEATVPPLLPVSSETEAQRLVRIKRFGDIPWEKWVKVQAIVSDYVALQEEWLREIRRGNASAVWEAFELFKQERRGDLAAAGLTPDEITECELHVFGDTLLTTFSLLEGIKITPEEQRAIYRATDWGERELHQRGLSQGQEIAIRERIGLAKYDQVRAILGPERSAVFFERDPVYGRFATLAKDLGQPEALVDQLMRIKSESLIRAGALPSSSAEPAAYQQQRIALDAEIRSRVVGLVGEEAIEKNPEAFEQWLRLKPKAPAAPALP
jgi:hypothetical protein